MLFKSAFGHSFSTIVFYKALKLLINHAIDGLVLVLMYFTRLSNKLSVGMLNLTVLVLMYFTRLSNTESKPQ